MAIFWKNDVIDVYAKWDLKLISFLENSKIVYENSAPAFMWCRKIDLVAA